MFGKRQFIRTKDTRTGLHSRKKEGETPEFVTETITKTPGDRMRGEAFKGELGKNFRTKEEIEEQELLDLYEAACADNTKQAKPKFSPNLVVVE